MKSNYEEALAAVLKHEGGFANHPKDPGGATMRGVTQAVYDAYRRGEHINQRSVKLITERELQEIYREQYWDVIRGDDLPSGVDYAVFDFAVNSGPKRAVEFLQRVIAVDDDGIMGPVTINAVNDFGNVTVVSRLCDARLAFLKGLGTWGTFGKGWENRVAGVRALALSLAKPSVKPTEPVPLPEQKDGGLLAFILRLLSMFFKKGN